MLPDVFASHDASRACGSRGRGRVKGSLTANSMIKLVFAVRRREGICR
jgi:hypothetical protein